MKFKELTAAEFVTLFIKNTKRDDLFFRKGKEDFRSTKNNYVPKVEDFKFYKFYKQKKEVESNE